MTIEKCATWKEFVVRRISRLYPAYWVCVVITTLLIYITTTIGFNPFKEADLLKKFLVNLTMLQYFFHFRSIDSPYWTLSVEIMFYFLMLLLFITKTLKKIEIIGVILLILVFLYGCFYDQIQSNLIMRNIDYELRLI